MSTLGKVLEQYAALFAERGFLKEEVRDRGPLFVDGKGRFVSYDRIKGGDLRCFLGVFTDRNKNSQPEIEAESCWWQTEGETGLETAAASSWLCGTVEAKGFFVSVRTP